MMRRMGRGGRRTRIAGMALGAALLAGWVGWGAAAVFDSPPTLGNRRVELTWQPDADDPVYNGNTVLRVEPRFSAIHGRQHAVRVIVSSSDGSVAYSAADGENVLRAWRTADGVVTGDLPLGPGAPEMPTALAMHSSDRRILGAAPNGDFWLWRLDRTGPPQLIPGRGPVLALRFYPDVRDTSDLRFITVGADDTLRVWRRPGELLGRGYAIPVVGGATGALDMSSDRKLVAVGTQTGEVRVYNVDLPPDTPTLKLEGHNGAVTGLAFSSGRRKLASVDATGQARVWAIPDGTLLTTMETGTVVASIGLSAPDGRYIFLVTPDGKLDIRSGDDGALFRSKPDLLPPGDHVTRSILMADGTRSLVGDDDGGITLVTAGTCRPTAEEPSCFGGYMIWRSPSLNLETRRLLRIYKYTDSTWTFQGAARAFSDPDSIIRRKNPNTRGDPPMEDYEISGPSNGVPYFYSVTRFDLRYLEGGVFPVFVDTTQALWNGYFRDRPGGPPVALAAGALPDSVPPLLGQVIVVPNPYEVGKSPWEAQLGPQVEFRNLPEKATIRIYTLAGDLVRVIDHGRGRFHELRDASAWDLKNSSGRRVASGVYVFQVETPPGNHLPGEVLQGFFTVVF
jgi:hypothetical protein